MLTETVAQLVSVGSARSVVAERDEWAEAVMAGRRAAAWGKALPLKLNAQERSLLQANLAAGWHSPALGDQSKAAELGPRGQQNWCQHARAAGFVDDDKSGLEEHRDRLLGSVVSHAARGCCWLLSFQAALRYTQPSRCQCIACIRCVSCCSWLMVKTDTFQCASHVSFCLPQSVSSSVISFSQHIQCSSTGPDMCSNPKQYQVLLEV